MRNGATSHGPEVLYTIDDADRIVYVNEGWNRFTDENEVSHLAPDQVLNRPLWNFIADAETRHLNQVLAARVRSGRGHLSPELVKINNQRFLN